MNDQIINCFVLQKYNLTLLLCIVYVHVHIRMLNEVIVMKMFSLFEYLIFKTNAYWLIRYPIPYAKITDCKTHYWEIIAKCSKKV